MGIEIVWTPRAIKTFGKRIEYLEEHWTEKEILNFTARVNAYLNSLRSQPVMFRKSARLKHTHVGVIIKQVSLVYRVKPSRNRIELIAFIDNRRNPQKQSY
ncbi:MAG: type II toxin-antitoxin system RelE/ParE family toxin [Mucilaginibacter sp.]